MTMRRKIRLSIGFFLLGIFAVGFISAGQPRAHAGGDPRLLAPAADSRKPGGRFRDNGNGTVTDRLTGLMWRKCSEGQTWEPRGNTCTGEASGFGWDDALNHVEILNLQGGVLGHRDWRLPTIRELSSLVDYDRHNPIDERVFPATPERWFWSSTPFFRFPKRAWIVAFGYGDVSTERIDNRGLHIRLVREAAPQRAKKAPPRALGTR